MMLMGNHYIFLFLLEIVLEANGPLEAMITICPFSMNLDIVVEIMCSCYSIGAITSGPLF